MVFIYFQGWFLIWVQEVLRLTHPLYHGVSLWLALQWQFSMYFIIIIIAIKVMIRTIRRNGWFTAWRLWELFLCCCHKIIGELPTEIICLEFTGIFLSWLWEFCWLCGHIRRKIFLSLSTCGFWFCCHSYSTFLLFYSAIKFLQLEL